MNAFLRSLLPVAMFLLVVIPESSVAYGGSEHAVFLQSTLESPHKLRRQEQPTLLVEGTPQADQTGPSSGVPSELPTREQLTTQVTNTPQSTSEASSSLPSQPPPSEMPAAGKHLQESSSESRDTTAPSTQTIIERYQTLIAGVLAIVAAAIAFWGAKEQAEATVRAARENIEYIEKSTAAQLQRSEDRIRQERITDQLVLAGIVSLDVQRLSELIEATTLTLDINEFANLRQFDVPPAFELEWRDLALLGDEAVDHIKRIHGLLIRFNTLSKTVRSERPTALAETQRIKQLQDICTVLASKSHSLLKQLTTIKFNLSNQQQ